MKRIAPGFFFSSPTTPLRRFSKSPRYLVPGDQRAHVEGVDRAVGQHVRDLLLDHEARQALGDRGLADAGLADVQRVVLAAAAQDLDGPLHLELPPDQRVHPPGHRPGHSG